MSLTDITGTPLRILLNYREKDAPAPNDHPAPSLPTLLQMPLNQIIDQLWSGIKDNDNKTMRDHAKDNVVAKIRAAVAATNIDGSFPATGPLQAGVGLASFDEGAIVGNLFLIYALPGETFTFNTGLAAWRLTFDTELEILINVPDQPGPLTANVKAKISNANISPANFAAGFAEWIGSFLTFMNNVATGQSLTLFQSAEENINQTTGMKLDSLDTLLSQLTPIFAVASGQGFLHLKVGLDGTGLFFRLTHPIDPAPVVTDETHPSVPFFQGPILVTSQSQINAGGQLLTSGRFFTSAHTTALYLEWNDTTSGAITESDIEWTPSNGPMRSARRPRQRFDNGNHFTITGVAPNTTFQVRVRDCDQLTCTEWSAPLAFITAASDEVDITLQSGSGSVLVAQATLGTDGTFSAPVTIPAGTSAGAYSLRATVGSETANAPIRVLGSGQAAQPVLTVIDGFGAAEGSPSATESEMVIVRGEGFAPGLVEFAVDTGQQLGTATAPANGIFTTNVLWPAGVLGNRRIIASQVVGGTTTPQASVNVFVQPLPR